ncbi:MAG: hypothetical protein H7257_03165 [Taibaiella sp.]|nr:hypothetical protein [Taibaiella sp.]
MYSVTFNQDLIFINILLYINAGAETQLGNGRTSEIVFIGTEEKHAIDAIKAGGIDYLLKPVMEQEVKAMLERWRAKKLKVEKLTRGITNLLGQKVMEFYMG